MSRNTFLIKFTVLCSSIFAHTVQAEMHQCNGLWTNKPCSGKAERVLQERPSSTRTQPEIEKDQKLLWINQLELKRVKAKRTQKVDLDISEVKSFCLQDSTSLIDCRRALNQREDEIDSRLTRITETNLRQREVEAQEKKAQQQNVTQVTVINNIRIDKSDHSRFKQKQATDNNQILQSEKSLIGLENNADTKSHVKQTKRQFETSASN